MLEIIVVYIYYIIDFDQHPGGDASRVLGHVSWKRTWPHFRSSLGGGVLVLLHIVGGIAIVQSPDGVHQLVVVLVGRVLAFWKCKIDAYKLH